jgi:HD-GYP domain-containing protein (c-di-GMP phosphodiesterase class II)
MHLLIAPNTADSWRPETRGNDAPRRPHEAPPHAGGFHKNGAPSGAQRTHLLGYLQVLTSAIDAKDHYTRGHSERVGLLAGQMARLLGLPRETVEHYRISGLVHDVGKIGVPDAVLCKSGRLTDQEFAQIKCHPGIGFGILKGVPILAAVLPGVLHHHERWDGRGYPHSLAGEAISPMARVVGLADAFDAMSSHRSYREARPREAVFAELRRNAGIQFDPALVELFLTLDLVEFDLLLARAQFSMSHSNPDLALQIA